VAEPVEGVEGVVMVLGPVQGVVAVLGPVLGVVMALGPMRGFVLSMKFERIDAKVDLFSGPVGPVQAVCQHLIMRPYERKRSASRQFRRRISMKGR